MLNFPACIPCILKQSHTLSGMLGIDDPSTQRTILCETMQALLDDRSIVSAPHFSTTLQSIIVRNAGGDVSYAQIKERNMRNAEQYMTYLSIMIASAADPFEIAVRASIAGNTIDLGANPNFQLDKEINTIMAHTLDLRSLPALKEDVRAAKRILFIADNYEEALFDKLLIPHLDPAKVHFAVRSAEILNDITLEDARRLGIDRMCHVLESGSVISGTALEQCSGEFMELYANAEVVIAKGQGNFETLLAERRPIYFMFKVKCEPISDVCGYPIGSSVLHYHSGAADHQSPHAEGAQS